MIIKNNKKLFYLQTYNGLKTTLLYNHNTRSETYLNISCTLKILTYERIAAERTKRDYIMAGHALFCEF